ETSLRACVNCESRSRFTSQRTVIGSKEDFMKMRFDLRFLALLTLIGLLLAACKPGQSRQTGSGSSATADGSMGGGPCKNVAICTLIPQSQVNTSLGLTAMFTSPETPINMGGMTSDQCNYSVGASAPGIHAEFLRQCHPDKFTP